MDIYTIKITRDSTSVPSYEKLDLGTYGSYGIKKLQFELDDLWNSMDAVDATFHNTPGDKGTTMVLDHEGMTDVPPEATAKATENGTITLRGVKTGVQIITVDIGYRCKQRATVPGKDSVPTPSELEQLVKDYQNRLDKSVPPKGEPGQVLTKTKDDNIWAYPSGGGGSGGGYTIGAGLKYDPDSNILSVDTTDVPEQDNTKPITSAGVYTTLGNIDVLLGTI